MIRFEPKTAQPRPPACVARKSVTRRLSDTIREMGFSGEAMTPEAFEQRGFSRAVVARCGGDARDIARRLSVRQIG